MMDCHFNVPAYPNVYPKCTRLKRSHLGHVPDVPAFLGNRYIYILEREKIKKYIHTHFSYKGFYVFAGTAGTTAI